MVRKQWKYILFFALLVFIIGELIGRFYGLCNHPVFIESDAYEYNYAANQDLKIYGNHFLTNEYSMRSKPVDFENDTTVVLLIGDSVINGGSWTDHEDLASSILEKRISDYFNKNIRVLNVSCGSWGPDNSATYIEKYGIFGADLIILVVSSHDARDHMTFEKKIGTSKQPDKQSFLAWSRLVQLLTIKYQNTKQKSSLPKALENDYLNNGFEYFRNLSVKKKIPLLLYLHASNDENKNRQSLKNKLAITQFCEENKIPYIDELQLGISNYHFRDNIHFNVQGQKFLAENLFLAIKEYPL